ncbi:nicotinamidase [Ureaplasma ceti]|uniref:nicotinamidase n=1 Tax=Ureaplasma ceti TaxID=3119530 RepID=A0ABP9U8Y9_9BACT
MKQSALLIIDMQNDFVEGGALPVTGGLSIVPIINNLIHKSLEKQFRIIATKDYHPEGHISFEKNKHLYENEEFESYLKYQEPYFWPAHCVQGTKGVEMVPGLDIQHIEAYFHKGMDILMDAYSAFFSNGKVINNYFIEDYLEKHDVGTIYICGLAEDFCVYNNAIDARKLGYEVYLIQDATKPVFIDKEQETLNNYRAVGVKIITSADFMKL